jgi:hypothetical protein
MLLQGQARHLRAFTGTAASPRLASVLARAKSISTNNVADLPAVPLPDSQEEAVRY